MKELTLGTKIFHIDEPNGVYELMKESPASTFWYELLIVLTNLIGSFFVFRYMFKHEL